MRLLRPFCGLFLLMIMSLPLQAAVTADKAEISQRFGRIGLMVQDVQVADIEGLFEVTTNQGLFFSSANGDHILQGKLYSLSADGKIVDVLTQRYARQVENFANDMIIYKADNEKYVVTVFTDITCGYCVKLHQQMADYNKLGITVRYLAYPRQGPSGDVAKQMAQVWCASDPKAALDDVKLKRTFNYDVKNLAQCQQHVVDQYNYGRQLGISGTPAILLSNGQLVGGYLPPKDLLSNLEAM